MARALQPPLPLAGDLGPDPEPHHNRRGLYPDGRFAFERERVAPRTEPAARAPAPALAGPHGMGPDTAADVALTRHVA